MDWDQQELSPQAAAILDNAARAYRYTGAGRVILEASPKPLRADGERRRAEAVREYLARRYVPVRVRSPSGEWRTIVEQAAAAPPPPKPRVEAPPRPSFPPPVRPRHRGSIIGSAPLAAPPPDAGSAPARLDAIQIWLTPTGTLTDAAMNAMTRECDRLQGRMTAECQSDVRAGEGGFRLAPEDARTEFLFLLERCLGARRGEECRGIVALNREFRALDRGRLEPRPLAMLEDERVLFTARIVQDPAIRGRPGRLIEDSDSDAERAAAGASRRSVVPFSRRMCFSLAAVNREDFLIEPPLRQCMNIQDGGGAVKYDPQWYVTPLRPGRRELLLVTELYVNDVKREFRHQPYPLPIEVTAKPSLWDRIDNAIRRMTATVNLAAGLAEALGALFVAIAGWAIWSWFRKRKKRTGGGRRRDKGAA